MLLELAKRLNDIDNDLSIKVNYNGKEITLAVTSSVIGDMYSFTCYSVSEAYNKVVEFSKCLTDNERFDSLLDTIENMPLEVALEV